MPWFKVDDGFANSKPVLRIPRRYRAAAVGLWTLAGTWSAKELTDGFIPDYALEDFCATPALAAQLVKAELWEEVSDGWRFIGWEKYQFTKAKVLEHREAEAEKKRKWREAKAAADDQRESDMSPRDTPGDKRGTPGGTSAVSTSTRPDQTRPVPSSLGDLGGGVTSVDGSEPPRYCEKHPNDTTDYCRPCVVLRKRHDAWKDQQAQREADEVDRQRQKREAQAKRTKDCLECDEDGWRNDDRAVKCRHLLEGEAS